MQYEGRQLKKFAATGKLESLEPKTTLCEVYHENSKLHRLDSIAYGLEISRMNKSPLIKTLIGSPYKVYSLKDEVSLGGRPEPGNDLEKLIVGRRSGRVYSGEAITQEELSKLLFYAYGITDRQTGLRAVASGGALYPLELYVLPIRIEGLEDGIYHYNIDQHCLDVVERGNFLASLKQCVTFQDIHIDDAALVVVVTAVFERSTIKYKDRGYRLILIEAGEVGQSFSLTASSLGLECCLVGGFLDDDLSKLLGVDGHREAPLLPVVFGRSSGAA